MYIVIPQQPVGYWDVPTDNIQLCLVKLVAQLVERRRSCSEICLFIVDFVRMSLVTFLVCEVVWRSVELLYSDNTLNHTKHHWSTRHSDFDFTTYLLLLLTKSLESKPFDLWLKVFTDQMPFRSSSRPPSNPQQFSSRTVGWTNPKRNRITQVIWKTTARTEMVRVLMCSNQHHPSTEGSANLLETRRWFSASFRLWRERPSDGACLLQNRTVH